MAIDRRDVSGSTGAVASDGAEIAPEVKVADGYWQRTFQSLSNPHFRALWLSMLFMMGGMNMQMVARGLLAWDLTHSYQMMGLISIGFAPPMLLFGMFGGVVADRIDRKRMIQVGQLGMVANAAVIALALYTDTITIWYLFAASIFQGTLFAFLMPARQSIIPSIVGDNLMANALALNGMGMSLMTLGAPAVGGIIYAWAGPAAAYDTILGLNAVSLIFSAMLPSVISAGKHRNVLGDLMDALKYAGRNRTVIGLLLIALGTTMFANAARNFLPAYVDDVFGKTIEAGGPQTVGWLLAVFGGGAFLGSLFIAGLRRGAHRGLWLIGSTLLSGVAVVGLGLAPILASAYVFLFFMGLADAGRRSLNNALLMEVVDDSYRGRISGIWMMNFGFMPIGILLFAQVSDIWDIRIASVVAGAGLLITGAWFLLVDHSIRRL
ncbi:MAG: MFS transporter [Chloroflexi bacterium]|nr:MFS transporter [Chloroflexota bacterium]MBT4513873.1 MFS transporter [Chloroflexota bacterium]MBT6682215.1 MFS transporter [Chloroflexota bacterium]